MGTDVLRSADGVRMLQDHKMGRQGPWESHHHHKGITDLSPRKATMKSKGRNRRSWESWGSDGIMISAAIWGAVQQFPLHIPGFPLILVC